MKRLLTYSLFAWLILAQTACESIVEGLNENPNSPTDAPANLTLTGVQLYNTSFHSGLAYLLAGMWAGYHSGVNRQYAEYNNYGINADIFNPVWRDAYQVSMQAQIVMDKMEVDGNRRIIGISKVLKANAMGTATAVWGDIPYTEISNSDHFPNPKFDPQPEVYSKLQVLLDEAIADLESGVGASPGTSDIYFGGNAASWIAVAHTLKARFYLETRNYEMAYAEAEKGVSSTANSMKTSHGVILSGNQNPVYRFLAISRTGDISAKGAYVATLLDPASANYKGNAKTDETARYHFNFINLGAAGYASGQLEPNYLSVAGGAQFNGIYAQDAKFPLVTWEENLLILAEAGARAKNFATGLTHLNAYRTYMNGGGYINATYTRVYAPKYLPYEEADFTVGGMVNKVNETKELALLREILQERYVSFIGQIIGFNDVRRTAKEAQGVKVPPVFGTVVPQRFLYAQTEVNSNTSTPRPIPNIFAFTTLNK
jgi:starch-binding outer membrane protein, SusD/RagB family